VSSNLVVCLSSEVMEREEFLRAFLMLLVKKEGRERLWPLFSTLGGRMLEEEVGRSSFSIRGKGEEESRRFGVCKAAIYQKKAQAANQYIGKGEGEHSLTGTGFLTLLAEVDRKEKLKEERGKNGKGGFLSKSGLVGWSTSSGRKRGGQPDDIQKVVRQERGCCGSLNQKKKKKKGGRGGI